MGRSGQIFQKAALCALFILMASGLSAQDFFQDLQWSFRGSVLGIFEDNGLESDPMPILAMPGLAVAKGFKSFLAVEASLDFYGTYYGYSDTLDRAVPYAIENRSSFVLGTLFAVQAQAGFIVGKGLGLKVYGGPGADLRLCLVAGGLEGADLEDASAQTSQVLSYFWGGGRWLYPVLGSTLYFASLGRYSFGADARIWFPAYKLWTGEDLPLLEGWRAAAGIRVTLN